MTTQSKSLAIRCLDQEDFLTWNALTQALSGCFMQSCIWADFKELEGYQTFRYGIFSQKKLVGGCIFYYYPRPHSANLLLAPGAPVSLPGFESEVVPFILEKATELAKKVGAIALRIEPLLLEKPGYLKGFVRAPADLMPSETLLIDLRPPVKEILTAMKPKGRYNLKLSQRHGVETKFTTDSQSIPIFYEIFWETVKRQQFFGEPYKFFINLCQTLFSANIAEVGFAEWQGEVLAAILVIYWGDRATYLYGGRSTHHPHVMASYALHWAAMQRARSKGCHFYDFYGYTHDPQHSYAKFSQFKRQFGGHLVNTIGAQDYFFYDRLADTLIKTWQQLENQSNQ
jgi:lipid II:glycine glycyltransferase (peptidoglycan interpeptide bridge formation enzyme)